MIIFKLKEISKYYCSKAEPETPPNPPPGGVLPEILGMGVRTAYQNPYPIYDQNLRFSLPYL